MIQTMDIQAIRVKRLKEFLEKEGGAAAVSRKFENVDASHLSQIINAFSPFGEKAARTLEKKLNLSPFYFDRLIATKSDVDFMINEIVSRMDENEKQQLLRIANSLVDPKKID